MKRALVQALSRESSNYGLGALVRSSACVGCLVALTATWPGPGAYLALAQSTSQQGHIRAAVSGQVVTSQHTPAEKADVMLKSLDTGKILSTTTDVSGSFAFKSVSPGPYTLTSEQGALHSRTLQVSVPEAAAGPLLVVLGDFKNTAPHLGSNALSPSGEIQFSDSPNFTVAGVTDWTAVGGHGSDATLRTSEDLTRETLAMKAQPSGEGRTGEMNTNSGDAGKENSLRAALASAPENHAANRALGDYYLHSARFQEAIPFLQTASDLTGGKADDEYQLALACQGVGDLLHARQHIQHALAQTQEAAFFRLEGNLDEKLGDPLSAVQHLERATQLDPTEENYFDWATELLLHRAIWQAAEVFAQGAKAYPASVRIKTGWGAALFAGALYDDAAKQLCEASELDPSNTEPYFFLGKIASASQALPPCVERDLKRFVGLQPTNAEASYLYAIFLLKHGSPSQLPQVEVLLRKTVALDPKHSGGYLQLGILSFTRKDYPAAIDFYRRAIDADPDQAEPYYRLGVTYDRIGRADLAKQQFRLHDEVEAAQAAGIDRQRRQLKQFLIVLKDAQSAPKRL